MMAVKQIATNANKRTPLILFRGGQEGKDSKLGLFFDTCQRCYEVLTMAVYIIPLLKIERLEPKQVGVEQIKRLLCRVPLGVLYQSKCEVRFFWCSDQNFFAYLYPEFWFWFCVHDAPELGIHARRFLVTRGL